MTVSEYSYRYDDLSHAKCRLEYHIVIVTKYRRPAMAGLEGDVECIVRSIASREGSGFSVVECGVDGGDHVHLLVRCKPWLSPGVLVSRVKQGLLKELWASHERELSGFYWRRDKRVLFSGGYFCESVGSNREVVREYIKKQAK